MLLTHARKKLIFILICTSLSVLILLQIYKQQTQQLVIPNVVHYVLYNQNKLDFIQYLSVRSVLKVQKPAVINFHLNTAELQGEYYNKLSKYMKKSQSTTELAFVSEVQPTHAYGQRLSSVYHASDVARIQILLDGGGIYLDTDTLLINNLTDLVGYDCVVGKPENQSIGTQLLMAKSGARFLQLWMMGYKKYKARDWYYNAGRYPTELLRWYPDLAHVEPLKFGVHYLVDRLISNVKWSGWRDYYAVHLLSRHSGYFAGLDEGFVSNKSCTTNFCDIARFVLDEDGSDSE